MSPLWCAAFAQAGVDWQDWSPAIFDRAAAEDKLVLLNVGAVWCHWCHVMEHETYEDEEVIARLERSFLTVSVDQDARPDLSQRYEDWGWPATVLFAADGTELAKLRGFIPPARMVALLDAFVADPTPGPSAVAMREPEESATLSAEQRLVLRERWDSVWDEEHGGWGKITKSLDGSSIELAFALGETPLRERALRTVTLQRSLLDPVWGGMYQYSDSGVWGNPHFEKIVPIQADNLRAAALAFAARHDPADRATALSIAAYLDDFLWREGYQASQDADIVPGEHAGAYFALDDAGRRALGVPRIDPHRTARNNGLLAAALAESSGWLGDEQMLSRAVRAGDWLVANCQMPMGAYSCSGSLRSSRPSVRQQGSRRRPDDGDTVLWLADTLAAGEAFLALHTAAADPRWLPLAIDALLVIDRTFRAKHGYLVSDRSEGIPGLAPLSHREDNARLVRFATAIARVEPSAAPLATDIAEHAMALCAGLATDGPAAPVLLADLASRVAPPHIVVVGSPQDRRTEALYEEARALPMVFRTLERRATSGDDLPSVDVPTAFVCVDGVCSPPVTDPTSLVRVALHPLR